MDTFRSTLRGLLSAAVPVLAGLVAAVLFLTVRFLVAGS